MLKKIKELDKNSFMWKLLLRGKLNLQVMESYLEKLTVAEIQKLIEDELSKKNKREKIIIPIVRILERLAMLISLGLCGLLAYRLLMRMEEVLEAIQYHIFLLVFAIVFFLIILILLNVVIFLLHQSLIRSIKNKKEKIEFMVKYLQKNVSVTDTNKIVDERMLGFKIYKTKENFKNMKKFKVTKGLLGSILYQYYPSISHKNAGRIIQSIEFKSDVSPEDEEEYSIAEDKLVQALEEHYPVVSHRRVKSIISEIEKRGDRVSD